MKALKGIAIAVAVVTTGFGAAHANADYVTSPEYKDVKFKIDQCSFNGSEFNITGWYTSKTYPASGELKVYLIDGNKRKEVPMKKIPRKEGSLEGFAGTLSTPENDSSFNADIELVEKVNGSGRNINYSCNSLQGGL